jgi:hypothetical protein
VRYALADPAQTTTPARPLGRGRSHPRPISDRSTLATSSHAFDSRRRAGPCSPARARPRSGAVSHARPDRGTSTRAARTSRRASARSDITPLQAQSKRVFPCRSSKDAAAMSGLVRHQSLKAAPPSVGPLDGAWDRIPIHEGPTRGSIRPQIEDASASASQSVSTARRREGGPRGLFD